MITDTLGIYIHIPFCKAKCNYCDFCSIANSDAGLRERYVKALISEIEDRSHAAENRVVDTIYIGGGTPSLLEKESITQTIHSVFENYNLAENAEITIEANPCTVTEEKLRAYRACGINRLSLGMQSSNAYELRVLGRTHTHEELTYVVKVARRIGFDNISLDVMYGIPNQTIESLRATLDSAISFGIPHISAYSLKIEEGTPFYHMRDTLLLPSEDTDCDMYEFICAYLEEHGYRHYEISNYAKDGYESRHNTRYWRCKEYIGVGAAAHSYFRLERLENTSSVKNYIDGERCIHVEKTSKRDREDEYIMLGLRLREGISDHDFFINFGYTFYEKYKARLAPLENAGYLVHRDNKTYLTPRGMYISNSIIVEILS